MDLGFLNRVVWTGEEEQRSSRYYFDNRRRPLHPAASVIQRTLAGEGFLEAGGLTKYCRRGSAMIFIHGEDSRYGYPPGGKETYHLEYITLTGQSIGTFIHAIRSRIGSVIPMPAGSQSFHLFTGIVKRFRERDFQDAYHESCLIYELLTAMLREAGSVSPSRDPLRFARDYVQERFHLPVTVEEIARAAGITREHLSRTYRARFGITPGRELMQLRMKAAELLLKGTEAQVEHISVRCGYSDPDAFSRAFKRETGASPKRYRSNHL